MHRMSAPEQAEAVPATQQRFHAHGAVGLLFRFAEEVEVAVFQVLAHRSVGSNGERHVDLVAFRLIPPARHATATPVL